MNQHSAQPDPPDSPEEAADLEAADLEPADLGAQVEALLNQIREQAPEALPEKQRRAKQNHQAAEQAAFPEVNDSPPPPEPAKDPASSEDPAPPESPEGLSQPDAPDAAADAAPAPEMMPEQAAVQGIEQAEARSDDLAQQIQALLDEAQAQAEAEPQSSVDATSADADAPGMSPTDTDTTATTDTDRTDRRQTAKGNADKPHKIPAASQAHEAEARNEVEASTHEKEEEEEDEDIDSNLLSRIDQMLAEQADEALASNFESVNELLGNKEGNKPQQDETASSDERSATTAASSDLAGAGGHTGTDDLREMENAKGDATVAARKDASSSHDRTAAANVPQSAADVKAAAGVEMTAAGATAADVARELDDQPERRPAAASAAAASQAAQPAPNTAAESIDHRRLLARLAASTRRTCGVINAPLYRFSPEVRSTIGWIGVVTLFNAACLLVIGMTS